jgi:hypothetical protein
MPSVVDPSADPIGQSLYVDSALGTNNPVNVGNEEQSLWGPDDGDL